MGWKKFKEQYKIQDNVQINEKGLCIGSGYVPDLVVVNLKTGLIKENSTFSGFLKENYPQLLSVSPEEILKVLDSKDSFSNSLPVFTYDGSKIVEEKTEEYGYPNCTHEGNIQYENTYFKTRKEAVEKAKVNNAAGLSLIERAINDTQKQLEKYQAEKNRLLQEQEELSKED